MKSKKFKLDVKVTIYLEKREEISQISNLKKTDKYHKHKNFLKNAIFINKQPGTPT